MHKVICTTCGEIYESEVNGQLLLECIYDGGDVKNV